MNTTIRTTNALSFNPFRNYIEIYLHFACFFSSSSSSSFASSSSLRFFLLLLSLLRSHSCTCTRYPIVCPLTRPLGGSRWTLICLTQHKTTSLFQRSRTCQIRARETRENTTHIACTHIYSFPSTISVLSRRRTISLLFSAWKQWNRKKNNNL